MWRLSWSSWIAACIAFGAAAPEPPGRMVDVGGSKVHLYCSGEGSPTVFIAGAGFSFDWRLVQRGVEKFTRVCTYDAAGLAWSEQAPGGQACIDRVGELRKVIEQSGSMGGPVVMVGLSIGALFARLYAAEYPKDVAGLVLVDHAFLDPEPPAAAKSTDADPSRPVLIYQAPIVVTVEDTSRFENLPEEARALHRWAMGLNPAMPTVEAARECVTAVGDRKLGSLPLTVISTGNQDAGYLKLQQRLLGLSTASRQRMALDSVHAVEIDQPDVIVRSLREMITGR